MPKPIYFNYWGKARIQNDNEAQFHLLPYHCLDVAAVGIAYLRRLPSLRQMFIRVLGCESGAVLENWLAFWLLLHDVGKFSESFQSQRPDIFERLRGRAPDSNKAYMLRHDSLGMLFWQKVARQRATDEAWFGPSTGLYEEGLCYWARAITGHHGQPPQEDGAVRAYFHKVDDYSAIFQFIADAKTALFPQLDHDVLAGLDPEAFEWASQALSWWLAGLTVLSDWLGSNTEYFPYRGADEPLTSLADYWEYAQKQAAIALSAAEVLPPPSTKALAFNELFPVITTPSPLQEWAMTTQIAAGPQIYLLEDVTGAGKTEAAITLAHRLMAVGQADGFFVGLPTMATANAMYGRVAQIYASLFEGETSLVLAHGQRTLVEDFASSIVPSSPEEKDAFQADETATARCSAWLADHNKRALLAPAGVGTIDQALLAGLQSKHQSLRLLGLLRKVLIVDEVHACDAYMQRILENLLEFHAHAGGSAILLSATLPQRMKSALINAFAKGCQQEAPSTHKADYPLASSWRCAQPEVCHEDAIGTRSDVQRTVAIDYLCDVQDVIQRIGEALEAGKCVCWMRNTVADALSAHALFCDKLPAEKLTLFHARFALQDRLRIEQLVLDCFGKNSTTDLRQGHLVIATQVVEQSLDADWDVVVSDLAPIDRIIQRAGRLQRHPRDASGNRLSSPGMRDQRGQPRMIVFGPAWSDAPESDWFKAAFRKAANVYPHHGQLWLSAKALQAGQFTMPDDARHLIETVFGSEAETPPALQHNANQAEGKAYGDISEAQQNIVKLPVGYQRCGSDWWNEAKAPSRLGEASVSVILARWEGDCLLPWAEHQELRHAWAYSTVRVAERMIARTAEPDSSARKQALEQALLTLPGKGQWSVLLPLERKGESWVGVALGRSNGNQDDKYELKRLSYLPVVGLFELSAPDDSSSGAAPMFGERIALKISRVP